MKSIQYIILVAVVIAYNWYALSGLGAPPVPEHRADTLTQYFTGSGWDWASFVSVNVILIAYFVTLLRGKSVDFNEVGSSGKNLIYAALLIVAFLLLYIG